MRRLLGALVLVAALGACHQADDERVERKTIDGVDCVVTRDGLGRITRTDCDWGQH